MEKESDHGPRCAPLGEVREQGLIAALIGRRMQWRALLGCGPPQHLCLPRPHCKPALPHAHLPRARAPAAGPPPLAHQPSSRRRPLAWPRVAAWPGRHLVHDVSGSPRLLHVATWLPPFPANRVIVPAPAPCFVELDQLGCHADACARRPLTLANEVAPSVPATAPSGVWPMGFTVPTPVPKSCRYWPMGPACAL